MSKRLDKKEKYKLLAEQQDNLPVFFQPWWLDLSCPTWDAMLIQNKKDETIAICPLPIRKKGMQKIVTQPFLTPFLGYHLIPDLDGLKKSKQYSILKKVQIEFSTKLKKQKIAYYNQFFPNNFNFHKPLKQEGFLQETYYRHRLNNLYDTASLLANLKPNKKYSLKKFDEEKAEIVDGQDAGLMYELISKSYQNGNNSIPFSKVHYSAIVNEAVKRDQGKLFFAKNNDGQLYAGVFILWDKASAYLISTGVDKKLDKSSSATTALIWHSILAMQSKVNHFDFCGSMIENISDFFIGFGGEEVPYYKMTYFKNRFFKMLYTLTR